MMTLTHNILPARCVSFRALPCIFAVLFLMLFPVKSFAQCEPPGLAELAMVGIIDGDRRAILDEMVPNITNFWTFDLDTLRMELGLQDQADWDSIFNTLNTWWTNWQADWKAMTAQLSASTVDQTLKLGTINNANNVLAAAQDEQKERIKAKLKFQPNEQACRFDTNAKYLARNRAISAAVQNGFEWDFVSVANNQKGSIAERGPSNLQNRRWQIYKDNFCDPTAESCDSGCSPPGGSASNCQPTADAPAHPNKDIYVSNMLFKDQTLAVQDQVALKAMQSMMFNVMGFRVPDPILTGALGTTAGIEQTFVRREYMAKMSAVGSLLYSVVGDRIQGVTATEPSDMRKMMGITYAFDKPSVREIRQSVIEQLWDPNFYKNLGDNPATISAKELYLKAYGLTMLYDLIAKQEKISTAYAIQTAQILKDTLVVSGNFSTEAAVGQ